MTVLPISNVLVMSSAGRLYIAGRMLVGAILTQGELEMKTDEGNELDKEDISLL
jgi:hypothetical protein